jgi:DUF1365 family protein
MNSGIYTGMVQHRRFLPKPHAFKYKVFMMYLDLDELPSLFTSNRFWSYLKPNLAFFKRGDYYGDAHQPLKSEIQALVNTRLGKSLQGKICLLTNMRYFGICFNPVSFYYCYAADNTTLEAIVTHITNTPWGENFAYVHDCSSQSNQVTHQFNLDKTFHVSPFMPMDIAYDWRFSEPSAHLNVYMQNQQAGRKMFDATLNLKYQPITARALNLVLLQYPMMTAKVIAAIYWQALRLWLKRIPFYPHPNSQTSSTD